MRSAVAVILAGLALAGCSTAQDAADAAKTAAVGAASSAASQAVADAVQESICGIVGDGQVSDTDLTALSEAVKQAEQAGVPAEFTDPIQEILNKGANAQDSLNQMRDKCANR